MALRNGLGGKVTFTSVTDDKGASVTPTYAAWAAATDYEDDDVVTTGTGPSIKYWKCLRSHTSAASGATASPTTDNVYWQETRVGQIVALFSWNVNESANVTTRQVMGEQGARKISSTLEGTGSLQFGALAPGKSGKATGDIVNKLFKPGNRGVVTIYPFDDESGDPTISFQAETTGRDRTGDENIMEVGIDLVVSGDVSDGVVS